jgi:hypothetical protein
MVTEILGAVIEAVAAAATPVTVIGITTVVLPTLAVADIAAGRKESFSVGATDAAVAAIAIAIFRFSLTGAGDVAGAFAAGG